jgi:hypothetical protein
MNEPDVYVFDSFFDRKAESRHEIRYQIFLVCISIHSERLSFHILSTRHPQEFYKYSQKKELFPQVVPLIISRARNMLHPSYQILFGFTGHRLPPWVPLCRPTPALFRSGSECVRGVGCYCQNQMVPCASVTLLPPSPTESAKAAGTPGCAR